VHGTVNSAAVITLLLVVGLGVKWWADRWGSTVHGTVSSAAVIILLLVGGQVVKRRGDKCEVQCIVQ